MKILFIENKFKTYTWQSIAKMLSSEVEIHWLVQNPAIRPKIGIVHYVQIPKLTCKRQSKDNIVNDELKQKDRFFTIYRKEPIHYEYYSKKIEQILQEIQPTLAIGEATLFHELITINKCKELGVLYLNPATCRYPTGRFSFYKYDTQIPYLGSEERWTKDKIAREITNISDRNVKPDYMSVDINFTKTLLQAMRKANLNLKSILCGEVYNTPSITQKYQITAQMRHAKRNFRKMSISEIENFDPEKCVIYPMQMQPEANLDVWGYPHNDQTKVIRQLSGSLVDKYLLIKTNPKWKYEINDPLVKAISALPNVYALSPSIKMESLFRKFKYFYTITGTIGHEALLGDKVCLSSNSSLIANFQPEWICDPEHINYDIKTLNVGFKKEDVINYLVKTSYTGVINDPVTATGVLGFENIKHLTAAFFNVLERIE